MSGGENVNKKNASNSAGTNTESNENNKDYIYELTGKFLRGFFDSKTESEIRDILNLTKDNSISYIPDEIKTKLLCYKTAKDKEFLDIDLDKINRFDLIKELMSRGGLKLQSSRKNAEILLKNIYNLNENQKRIIGNEIEKLTQSDINSLIKSELNRNKFIIKLFRKNKPSKNKSIAILKKIEGLDYNSLDKDTKQSLEDYAENGYETPALIELLKNKFSIEQKKVLIRLYLGPVSLAQLKDFGIIDCDVIDSIIDKKVKEILKSYLGEKEINERIAEVKDFLNPYNIFISPDEIFSISGADEEKIANELLEQDVFTNFFKEARNQAKETEEKEEQISKDEFLLKLSKLRSGVKNLGKIQNGDVIKCIKKDEDGDGSFDSYIYIQIVDINDDNVRIRDITHTSGGDKICKDYNSIGTENYSFSDMLCFFERIDGGNIYSEKDFKDKVENKNILSLTREDVEIKTEEELKSLINNCDSKGANFGLEVGTTFNFTPTEKGDGKKTNEGLVAVASITKIENGKITIRSIGETTFSFTEFYHAFNNQKGERITKIKNNKDLLQSLQGNTELKGFGELEWDKDEKNLIYSIQKDNIDFPKIDYFMNKKGECLKIVKCEHGMFDVQIGKFEEKVENKEKKTKSRHFKADSKSRMTPEILFAYLSKNGLNPYIDKDSIIAQENINKNGMEQKTSVGQAIFKMHNFASILAGGKQFVDHIKHTLKATNELQAAEFALSLGKILPTGMQSEFRAKVDGVTKGKMNDKIKELENLGPAVVMEYITNRLKIKNLPKYELEALLIFVMKKHGSLYPTDLKEYAGSYFWFKKLAGLEQNADITKLKIYQDYANPRTKDGLPIVEEDLIERLIGELCKTGVFRSSFTGEFSGAYGSGMKASKDGGLADCKDKYTTIDGKINFAKDRILAGRYMNAIGAVEGILDKGGSAQQMNHIPFLLLTSGILRTLDGKGTGEFIKSLGNKHREPMLLFCASPAKMDIFDKILMDFSKEEGGDMKDEANAIMEARKKGNQHEKIVKLCDTFWQKHGSKIVTKFNTTDPEMMIRAKEKGGEYSDYMGLVNAFFKDSQCSKEHKDNGLCEKDRINFMACGASFLGNNLSLSGANKSFRSETQEKIFSSIIEGLDDIRTSNYDEEKKKKIFRFYNIEILKWLIKNPSILPYEKLEKLAWGSKLTNRLWIPKEVDCYGLTHNIEGLESGVYNAIIDNTFKEFSVGEVVSKEKTIENKANKIKITVDDILKTKDNPIKNLDLAVIKGRLKNTIEEANEFLNNNSNGLDFEQEERLKDHIEKAEIGLKKNNPEILTRIHRELEKYLIEVRNEVGEEDDYEIE